jgi:hypothetical protein
VQTTTIESLRAQHAAFCDDLYARLPGQEVNRANHERFRRDAKLGKATRRIKLKGTAVIDRGAFVLFTPSAVGPDCVDVWAPGISAIVQASKIIAVGP